MINLHESMGPGRDRNRDPWNCSQTRICSQTRYRLRYAARWRDAIGPEGSNCFSRGSVPVFLRKHIATYNFPWREGESGPPVPSVDPPMDRLIRKILTQNDHILLTHINQQSFLWDMGKQCRPRSDNAQCHV